MNANHLLAKKVSFFAYKITHPLLHVLPWQGQTIRYVTLSAQPWLLVGLLQGFEYGGNNITHVIIKTATGQPIQLRRANQLVQCRLVPNPDLLQQTEDIDSFPHEFWVLVK